MRRCSSTDIFSQAWPTKSFQQMEFCLPAAQDTINLLHDAYPHRYYFQSWWYNAKYMIYACLIVLYALLLDFSNERRNWLIKDVHRAIRILNTAKEFKVAKRYSGLVEEILNVTKQYMDNRQCRWAENILIAGLPNQDTPNSGANQKDWAVHRDESLGKWQEKDLISPDASSL